MGRITWDAEGERRYEIGLDRGVLYVAGEDGVPWNGLISVTEKAVGGTATAYYVDGQKYLNVSSPEEYAGTITAYTYPDEFMVCDSTLSVDNGLFIRNQARKTFSLCYRTKVGNDVAGDSLGYKLHIVYNCLAAPSERQNDTTSDTPHPLNFSWDITSAPPAIPGFRPSAHLVIDTRIAHPGAVSDAENILYGTSSNAPRMPTAAELIEIFEENATLRITDNGDGTWTATTTQDGIITMTDGGYEPTVIDDFNDGSFNTSLWETPDGSVSISESAGKLHMQATSSFPALLGTTTNDLSTGFYAAQYSFSGTPNGDENLYVGAEDPDGNQAYVAYHKSDNSWFTDTEGATSHSGDVLVTPVTVSDGDWIGIGNIGSDNIIHAYHSVDGQSWTEFYRFVVGGSFNKSLTSFSVVVADSSGSGSLVISIDNASFFMPAPQSFQITWASAISTGADTYTISSL